MPVAGFGSREGPLHGIEIQTGFDLGIIGHIDIVIVVNEGMSTDRVIQRNCGDYEQYAKRPGILLDSAGHGRTQLSYLRC